MSEDMRLRLAPLEAGAATGAGDGVVVGDMAVAWGLRTCGAVGRGSREGDKASAEIVGAEARRGQEEEVLKWQEDLEWSGRA
jgi:hypothetical protein